LTSRRSLNLRGLGFGEKLREALPSATPRTKGSPLKKKSSDLRGGSLLPRIEDSEEKMEKGDVHRRGEEE
jgi:hypothetical protein